MPESDHAFVRRAAEDPALRRFLSVALVNAIRTGRLDDEAARAVAMAVRECRR
jgi:hypothetical protein